MSRPVHRRLASGTLAALLVVACVQAPALDTGFDAQGHRGARGLLPENSLPAFAHALELGVDTLEMDTGVTRDGVVVVLHDQRLSPAIARDAAGRWVSEPGPAVRELTFAELRAYDVGRLAPGSRYAQRFASQRPVDGTRVPALAEVFELVKRSGNAGVRLNIETKLHPERPTLAPSPEAFAEALLAVAREHGMLARIAVQSFDWRTLQVVQRLAPDVPTVYLTARQRWLDNVRAGQIGVSPWTAGFDVDDQGGSVPRLVKAAGGAVWSPFHLDLDPPSLRLARELGLRVIVWTVNEPKRMRVLIDMGVDGIISDYPDRLLQVVRR